MASSLQDTPRAASSVYDRYATLVHNHSTMVKFFESSIMNVAYYAPSRFNGSSEVLSEIGYSVSLLLGLLHDTILAAPPPGTSGAAMAAVASSESRRNGSATAASPRGASSATVEAGGVEWADHASAAGGVVSDPSTTTTVSLAQLATMASVLLAVVQHVQVVLELVALRKGGLPARHRVVVTVEATKFMLRMIILAHRQSTLLDGGAYSAPLPEESEGPYGAAAESNLTRSDMNPSQGGFSPGHRLGSAPDNGRGAAAAPSGAFVVVQETYVGRRSGRKMVYANIQSQTSAGNLRQRKGSNAGVEEFKDGGSSGGSDSTSRGSGGAGGGGVRSSLDNKKDLIGASERGVGLEEGQARPAWLDAPAVDLDANGGSHENQSGATEVGYSTTSRIGGSVALRWQRSAATVSGPGSTLWRAFNLSGERSSSHSGGERAAKTVEAQRATVAAWAARWNIAAEVLCFARPLVQVILNHRLVLHQWRALASSLCCDLLALFCRLKADRCRAALVSADPARNPILSPVEAAERARRQMAYWYYLLRAPLWQNLTRPAADAVEGGIAGVPILGGLANYVVSFLHYSQSRHFYSEPV